MIFFKLSSWELGLLFFAVILGGCVSQTSVETKQVTDPTQDGTVVCTFRRRVLVPKRNYLEARGGDHPGADVRTPSWSTARRSGTCRARGAATAARRPR